jgi:hypothetical protein
MCEVAWRLVQFLLVFGKKGGGRMKVRS